MAKHWTTLPGHLSHVFLSAHVWLGAIQCWSTLSPCTFPLTIHSVFDITATRKKVWRKISSWSPRRITFSWWGCYGSCLKHKLTQLAHSFLFRSFVCFGLYGPFNFTSFDEFSRQLSVFSLCSSGLFSALLVLSAVYLFMKVSFSSDIIPRSGELRTQKLKSHLVRTQSLNVLPFKPGVDQYIAIHCYAYCQGVLPCLFLPFQSIHLHFFQNLSQFFPVLTCRIK